MITYLSMFQWQRCVSTVYGAQVRLRGFCVPSLHCEYYVCSVSILFAFAWTHIAQHKLALTRHRNGQTPTFETKFAWTLHNVQAKYPLFRSVLIFSMSIQMWCNVLNQSFCLPMSYRCNEHPNVWRTAWVSEVVEELRGEQCCPDCPALNSYSLVSETSCLCRLNWMLDYVLDCTRLCARILVKPMVRTIVSTQSSVAKSLTIW